MRCDRCQKETGISIMSFFNTDTICLSCEAAEKAHPQYKQAREAEHRALMSGDYNFPGIGWPPPKNEQEQS